jgi:histidinol dehydrogenase
LGDLEPDIRQRLFERAPADEPALVEGVRRILGDVRSRGDEALEDMAERFDRVRLEQLEVPASRMTEALDALDPDVHRALERAADNIRRFHEAQMPTDVTLEVEPGVRITRRWTPLRSVGVYAPGGRAAYPSSVLMGVIPARAAGVERIVVCSPPGPSGAPPDEVLAACAVAGASRVFALGGAGAVAAMAFGTRTVPTVDAIVGPGNQWVTEAKRQVAGRVLIDSPAGPSEVLILADDGTDPRLAAHELLAQAEHDPEAACVLVSTSASLADAVGDALAELLSDAPRGVVAADALAASGALLVADSLDAAVAFAQSYAPEHLSVMTADPGAVASRISTAGTTFVGAWASVAFGDYMTGANHVLPTAGRACSFSGLSTQHYLRSYTVQEITAEGAASMAEDVALLAAGEGLPAHGAAALARKSL